MKTPGRGDQERSGFFNRTPRSILGKGSAKKNKGKAPQPPKNPLKGRESESSELTNYNGSFKHYDFQYSSTCETSSNNLKNLVKIPAKINNIEANLDREEKKYRRLSPPYLTVINKHGDEVEYALPYSEQDNETETESPPLPTNPPPNDTVSRFEQIINENFVFLKDMIGDETELNQRLESAIEGSLEQFMERRSGKDVVVTDLDKSIDQANQNLGEFFLEFLFENLL
jgi:hypothetical protein